MENRRKICFINGSLRGKKSSSGKFLNEILRRLNDKDYEMAFTQVKARVGKGYPETTLNKISGSAILVFAFPLYNYCLPGALTRLLEEYYEYRKKHNISRVQKVYAMINCGYFEPGINDEAIRVMKNFCARLNLHWRLAISIGCGPVVALMKPVDFKLRRAFNKMAEDIIRASDDEIETLYIKPILPRIIMDSIRMQIDRNALKRSDR
jgi:hypothetical protein